MNLVMGAAAALYALVLAALCLYSLECHALVWLARRVRREPDAPPPAAWPRVTVQLPVYNEPEMVERLLAAAARLEYPRPVEIQLLDDSTDETSVIAARAVAALVRAGHRVVHLRRSERRGFKAGALADGLALAEGEALAIFDADFLPEPDFLLRTLPHLLAPGVGVVQARWGHQNRDEGPLTRAQALAIDGHFGVEQPARAGTPGYLGAFNGSAGAWRREAIAAAGGWSADTLTEDLDLSLRAQFAGWRVRYLEGVVVPAELPRTAGALKAQQRRWAQGSIQNARKHWRAVLTAPLSIAARLEAMLHLTHYFVQPLILLSVLLLVPLDLAVLAGGDRPGLATLALPLLLASGGPTAMYLAAQHRLGQRWWARLRDLPWLLLLGTGLCVSNTVGVVRALAGGGGTFERTPKGSRMRAGQGGVALGLVEVAIGLGCFALAADLLGRGLASFAPFLLLDGAGLVWVGGASLAERAETIAPTPARRAREDHA